MSASFETGKVPINVSSESAITTIALSLVDGEMFPISGFPRALLATRTSRSDSACLAYSGQRTLTTSFGSVVYIPEPTSRPNEAKACHMASRLWDR